MKPYTLSLLLATALASGQTMTEFAGAAAGSTVGSAAGKQVSNGITAVFGKVSDQTKKAASTGTIQVGAAVPAPGAVPPPPPAPGEKPVVAKKTLASVRWQGPVMPPEAPVIPPPVLVVAPPPPPRMTQESLTGVAQGMTRQQVLSLGAPSSRISMVEDGRLVEVYRYAGSNGALGTVRLQDGAVANVKVNP